MLPEGFSHRVEKSKQKQNITFFFIKVKLKMHINKFYCKLDYIKLQLDRTCLFHFYTKKYKCFINDKKIIR